MTKFIVRDPPPRDGEYLYVTLDGLLVPVCQEADDEIGYVVCAVMDDQARILFDHETDEYLLIRRAGKVEFHRCSFAEWQRVGMTLDRVEAFPYEIPVGARPIASGIPSYKVRSRSA